MTSTFALTRVREELNKKGDAFVINRPFSKYRFGHYFIVTKRYNRYYIIYKDTDYKTYGSEFENNEGHGESINEDALERALKLKIGYILFVMKDGKIYCITPSKVKEIANKRIQKGGEVTFSFSRKETERWDLE